ncbi:MAG: hypothetical protein WB630_01680 [Candidatus Acidiferrales bacterium]
MSSAPMKEPDVPSLLVCVFWGMQCGAAKKLVCFYCPNELALEEQDDPGGTYEPICPECFLKEAIYVGNEGDPAAAARESQSVINHMKDLVRRFRATTS